MSCSSTDVELELVDLVEVVVVHVLVNLVAVAVVHMLVNLVEVAVVCSSNSKVVGRGIFKAS